MKGIPAGDLDYNEIVYTQEQTESIAEIAIQSYIEQSKGESMNKLDLQSSLDEVLTESQTSGAILTGEALLDNLQTIAEKVAFSRMSWYKKLIISESDKEIAVTVAMYLLIHMMKTGVFGLTKYRVDHALIQYVSLACNTRILRYTVKSFGVDTNVAKMLFTAPTISTGA